MLILLGLVLFVIGAMIADGSSGLVRACALSFCLSGTVLVAVEVVKKIIAP